MKKEYVVLIAIVALAAIWYFFFRNTNAVTIPGQTAITPTNPAPALWGQPATNATATAPSQTLTTPATTGSPSTPVQPVYMSTVDPSQYDAVILPWMNTLPVNNKQQALSKYPSMSSAEKAALADIIINVWGGKRPQTQADTDFWNAWRVKYHIMDGTINGFMGDPQIAYAGVNNFSDPQIAYNGFDIKGSPQMAYNGATGHTRKM